MEQFGSAGRLSVVTVSATAVVAVVGLWAVLVVVWPRLASGDPVSRHVAMASLPLGHEDAALCSTGFVAAWHADVVTYYASTGCSGDLEPASVSVVVDSGDTGPHRRACDGDQWVGFGCTAREVEGSLDCPGGCTETTLTVTHEVDLAESAGVPEVPQRSSPVEGATLSCTYTVTQHTRTIERAWQHGDDVFVCETRTSGERRWRLDDFSAGEARDMLVVTAAGPALIAATQEGLRDALSVGPGPPTLEAEAHASQCTD